MNKKLYRSSKDKVLGGVCGGLGEYFGIDPIILRLVLIILFLAGAMGFLIYIIAWILIPMNPETISNSSQSNSGQTGNSGSETIIDITPKSSKKLFRAKSDSPDRMIGGVCFGFAKFFGVDATWVRLGFLISILCLGFGSLIYILSWIIIPEEE